MGAPRLVGRLDELREIAGMLDDRDAGTRALLVEGPAGIGKTALWRATVDEAQRRSLRVLSCRPAEAESALPFASLADLLRDVGDDVDLPEPQRHALDVALRRTHGDATGDRLTLGIAVSATLRALAVGAPILVAVDDLQWLDGPTTWALEFALRRLDAEPVLLLAAARPQTRHRLLDAFDDTRVQRLRLGPLAPAETEALLGQQVGLRVTRPMLSRIHATTGGNPLFAQELGRALAESGWPLAPGDLLPVPETLSQLVAERLAALSVPTRDALLIVAALAQPTADRIAKATPDARSAIAEAISAGVIAEEGGRLAFTHTLFASAVYGSAEEARRREVHRRLAQIVDDPEERAMHLARGGDTPNEKTALVLEQSAERASCRGAPETAAELAEHARRLTPTTASQDVARRALAAAAYTWAAGDGVTSRRMIEELIATLPSGPPRARARYLLTRIVDDLPLTIDHLAQALDEAADDPRLRASLHALLARQLLWSGDPSAAISQATRGAQVAEAANATAELAAALGWVALAKVFAGSPTPVAEFERALTLERETAAEIGIADLPSRNRGVAALIDGDLTIARRYLEAADAYAAGRSDSSRAIVLQTLAELDLREGNADAALAKVTEAEEIARQWAVGHAEASVLAMRAFVNGWRGDIDGARRSAGRAIALMHSGGYEVIVRRAERALGFLELSLADARAADAILAPLIARAGITDPFAAEAAPDEVEALVALGRLDEAQGLLADVERTIRARPSPVARSRALIEAARGDSEAAAVSARAAVATASEPMEAARALLVSGAIERRRKRKTHARAALEDAADRFTALGAPLWADRARAELNRTGLQHADAGELTPTERRVAELAAAGSKNREIAAALFMSLKTVEANLSRVYAKLGVRSRAELARRVPAA